MDKRDLICIVCPVGCRMTITVDDTKECGFHVEGNKCKRGIDYGIKELTNPMRILTTTVKIKGARFRRLPVKTDGLILKNLIFECMKLINSIEVSSPVKNGEILLKNIMDTGVNIVSTRSM